MKKKQKILRTSSDETGEHWNRVETERSIRAPFNLMYTKLARGKLKNIGRKNKKTKIPVGQLPWPKQLVIWVTWQISYT